MARLLGIPHPTPPLQLPCVAVSPPFRCHSLSEDVGEVQRLEGHFLTGLTTLFGGFSQRGFLRSVSPSDGFSRSRDITTLRV